MTQIKLTRDEKVKKYNRLTKRELIEMLIECEIRVEDNLQLT